MIKFIKEVVDNIADCLKRMGEGFEVANYERPRYRK